VYEQLTTDWEAASLTARVHLLRRVLGRIVSPPVINGRLLVGRNSKVVTEASSAVNYYSERTPLRQEGTEETSSSAHLDPQRPPSDKPTCQG